MNKLWKSDITFELKLRIFKAICIPILLYSCETWTVSKSMENMINSFGTSCYRRMLGINWIEKVSNETIYKKAHTYPLYCTVLRRQLEFLGTIMRLPEETTSRKYALFQANQGFRNIGRPKMTYVKYIENVTQLSSEALRTLAQDESLWENVITDVLSRIY